MYYYVGLCYLSEFQIIMLSEYNIVDPVVFNRDVIPDIKHIKLN